MEVAPLRANGAAESTHSTWIERTAHPAREQALRTRIESGEYLGVLRTRVTGPLYFRILVEDEQGDAGSGTFDACTPRGVAWSLIGGVEGAVGSLLVSFLFPGGSILTWESSQPGRDAEGVLRDGTGTIGVGTRSSLRVGTRTRARDLATEIVLRDGRTLGMVELMDPADAAHAPRTDYVALARGVAEAIRANLYDARLVETGAYRAYFSEIERRADAANDDLEFLLGMGLAARRHLRNAPPLVYRPGPDARAAELLADVDGSRLARVWKEESARVAVLRIDAFLSEAETLAALREALTPEPGALVLDLRTCVGGDLSSLHVLAALVREETDAGTYVGRDARRDAAPVQAELTFQEGLSSLALSERANMRVRVRPAEKVFAGPVAVLVSKRTGSTAESLALILQQTGRARLYGERTPGLMRLTREFDAGQGWIARFGAYDYIAPGEDRPRRTPVTPDVLTTPAKALPEALVALGVSQETAEAYAQRERGSARPLDDVAR